VQFIGLHSLHVPRYLPPCGVLYNAFDISHYGLPCRTTARKIYTLLKHCLSVWCKFIFKAPHNYYCKMLIV